MSTRTDDAICLMHLAMCLGVLVGIVLWNWAMAVYEAFKELGEP